jgi:two-component sensor histidine kinase
MGLAEKQLGAEVSIKSEGGTEVRIVFKEPDVNPSL